MSDDPTPATLLAVDCVGRKLNWAARSARQVLDRHLAARGTTFSGYITLSALRWKGPLIQRRLARVLGVEGPTLTRQLDRLEAEGLIARTPAGDDRRAVRVELTEAGAVRLEELREPLADAAREVSTGLTVDDLRQLDRILDLIVDRGGSGRPGQAEPGES
ncbi:MAG TPA: MarR family transcriptional regulator [Candidatus Dormibacteraeota bacterium]|jgi:MarR family transcriptional regulator for hemolysin|nr:MarR family transcriptional regulator [Candidatus Dormibacteraeota bacterium]